MSKRQIKFSIFVGGLLTGIVVAAVGFNVLSNFIASFQQGADPASIFHGAALNLPDRTEARWLPDMVELPVQPSPAQREEILAAYWAAWQALERAYQTGDTSDLLTYWAGTAYEQIAALHFGGLVQSDDRHRLALRFFSDDRTIAALEDRDFRLHLTVGDRAMTIPVNASVVMTLDNGYWRIRLMTIRYEEGADR